MLETRVKSQRPNAQAEGNAYKSNAQRTIARPVAATCARELARHDSSRIAEQALVHWRWQKSDTLNQTTPTHNVCRRVGRRAPSISKRADHHLLGFCSQVCSTWFVSCGSYHRVQPDEQGRATFHTRSSEITRLGLHRGSNLSAEYGRRANGQTTCQG